MAEKIIQNPSITPNDFGYDGGAISSILGAPLVGAGGGTIIESDFVWLPSVTQEGVISWQRATSATAPSTANIMGPRGLQGPSGTNGKDGTNGTNGTNGTDGISPTFTITPTAGGTHITISGAQGKDGFDVLSGAKGADGTAGFSPLFTITDVDTGTYPQGGKHVAIQYGDGGLQNTAFDILNGIDGTGATVNLLEGTGIKITHTGTSYTIGVSADYALKSELPDVTDMATKTWVGQQGYLTSIPDSYATKTYVDNASAEALSQAKSWTNLQNFATSAGLDATKQYAMTTAGWKDFDIPSTSGYLPLSGGTVSGATYFSAANGQNMVAVASAATLIGASRQTSAHFGQDTNALGTTWIGVGGAGMYRGFLKYTQGGNVGDLESSNTMQVEFTPNDKGTIFARAKNNNTDCPETQILNPTKASCDAMVQSANANLVSGPNYMLAKNADGQFVIGAACVNCTDINNVTLAPNTYYFVYEV